MREDLPFYAKNYSLVNEIKKTNLMNQYNQEKAKEIIKKDLNITMRYLSEERKMKVMKSMNIEKLFRTLKEN